jgi:acyl-CoA reductase-like NAD-dependent aldehyde dehydrogenase
MDGALPWGGVKDSGWGVSLSALAFDQVTRAKAISQNRAF